MKLEDMKVGAFVKCTKPERYCCDDCYDDTFRITNKLPDNQWEIERITGKPRKTIISQKNLQHNFKLYVFHTLNKIISISFYADGVTSIESDGQIKNVGLYHEDKYDEFVGAVEALAKLYDRKSPFDEIEELKDVARAAAQPIKKEYGYGETVKLEGKSNATIKAEPFEVDAKELYAKPHSPVDDMDLTPPLEVGCLIKIKDPYTNKLKGKWFKVSSIKDEDESCLALISVFLEPDKLSYKAFPKENLEIVKERYHNIWDEGLKYHFGDRVVLTQTGFNVKRKSYGTVIDWRRYNDENYYIVHWDDEDARFLGCKEEVVPEYCLLSVRYE